MRSRPVFALNDRCLVGAKRIASGLETVKSAFLRCRWIQWEKPDKHRKTKRHMPRAPSSRKNFVMCGLAPDDQYWVAVRDSAACGIEEVSRTRWGFVDVDVRTIISAYCVESQLAQKWAYWDSSKLLLRLDIYLVGAAGGVMIGRDTSVPGTKVRR
jgi:hypothetical protein